MTRVITGASADELVTVCELHARIIQVDRVPFRPDLKLRSNGCKKAH